MMEKIILSCIAVLFLFGLNAQEETRLLRFPAIYGDQVVFTYAFDKFYK